MFSAQDLSAQNLVKKLFFPMSLWMLTATLAQAGVVAESGCGTYERPAATLLLPYFEADLDDTEGQNTLVTVRNLSSDPALVRATLWTDWSIPTLGFDLLIDPRGVRSLDLRRLLTGNLPTSGDHSIEGCADPLTLPELDADGRARLRAWHTGRPDPVDELCSGSDRGETSLATGYLTIDTIRTCDASISDPSDPDYFGLEGAGLASNENILVGDFFLLDGTADSAQSGPLVHLPADEEYFVDPAITFYDGLTSQSKDARMPLSSAEQARYLSGGIFDGGTDLLIWVEPLHIFGPLPCGTDLGNSSVGPLIFIDAKAEDGTPALQGHLAPPATAFRAAVGGPIFPVDAPFGTIRLSAEFHCGICSPPFLGPAQIHVIPVVSAAGGFSAIRSALPIGDLCSQ